MRGIDAIFAAAGEAMQPFLQEAFDAGKTEGRKETIEEFKAKIAAVWDGETSDAASNRPGSLAAAVRKIEQQRERPRSQPGQPFAELRTAGP
jgi:hypothetical protein